MKNIDLTNYNNFYKTREELEELRKELYKLASDKDCDGLTEKEFNEFFITEGDEIGLRSDLSICQLIDLIEQCEDAYYSFGTFAKGNEKRKEFYERPKVHGFSTREYSKFQREYAEAQNFEVPTEEDEE